MLELDGPDESTSRQPLGPETAAAAFSLAGVAVEESVQTVESEAVTSDLPEAHEENDEEKEADESREPLTFREHLWDRFDVIWARQMNPSRKMLEGFVCCMRERAQLERQYARGLLHSVAKLQQTTSGGAVPLPLEAVVSNLRHRAEQCAVLAEELDQAKKSGLRDVIELVTKAEELIKDYCWHEKVSFGRLVASEWNFWWLLQQLQIEVADTVERMLEQHAEVSRRMHSDGVCLMRHWQSAGQGFDGAEERYHQACSIAELEAIQCAALSALKPAEWKQWAERTIRASRQAVAAEKDFQKVLHKFNTSVELQEKQMALVLDAAQDMEEKRAMCFQDAVMKIAVFDTSWLRNVQYDIDSGVQALEDSDGFHDLQTFMRRNRTKATFPSKHPARPPWEMCATDPGDGEAIRSESIQASDLASRKTQELQPLIRSLLHRRDSTDEHAEHATADEAWKLPNQEEVSRLCDLLAGRCSDPPGLEGVASECLTRTAFCSAIRSELSSAVASEAAVRSSEPPQAAEIGEDAFEIAVSLFQAALDGADKDCDVWNGRELLVLSKFLQLEESRKDVLLRVYNHPLWSRVTFWEDLLLAGLAEAHFQLILSRWASPVRLPESLSCLATSVDAASAKREVQEVVMTPFLQRYMAYMVSLGINFEQARGSAMRTLRKHVELLGTSHEAYVQLITHEADAMPLAFGNEERRNAPR